MKKYSSRFVVFSLLVFILIILFILSFVIYICSTYNNIRYNDLFFIFILTCVLIGIIFKYIELRKYDYDTLLLNKNEMTLKGKNCISISIKDIDKIEYDNTYLMRGAYLGIVKIYTYTRNEYIVLVTNTKQLKKDLNDLLVYRSDLPIRQ